MTGSISLPSTCTGAGTAAPSPRTSLNPVKLVASLLGKFTLARAPDNVIWTALADSYLTHQTGRDMLLALLSGHSI